MNYKNGITPLLNITFIISWQINSSFNYRIFMLMRAFSPLIQTYWVFKFIV